MSKESIKRTLPKMSDCTINRLTDEQVNFIVRPIDTHCFLSACPGSGKTEVVGIKVAFEIANWEQENTGIAVLSFTNGAAIEIKKRTLKFCDGLSTSIYPHFIGTFDSLVHGYLLQPHGHIVHQYRGDNGDKSYKLLESKNNYSFLKNFKYSQQIPTMGIRMRSMPIYPNQYHFTIDGVLSSDNLLFHSIQDNAMQLGYLTSKKTAFIKDGFITHDDVEYMVYQLLNCNANIAISFSKRFPLMVIDECQDLSYGQLRILHLLIQNGLKIIFIGDIYQSIYSFRGAQIDAFNRFIAFHEINTLFLSNNFRSNQKIVDVCQNLKSILISDIPRVSGVIVDKLADGVLLWEYNSVDELKTRYNDYLDLCMINKSEAAILTRGSSLKNKILSIQETSTLNDVQLIASALINWNPADGSSLQLVLKNIGKAISNIFYKGPYNTQQYYTPAFIDNVDWRNFLYNMLIIIHKNTPTLDSIIWSVFCRNLKDILRDNESIFVNNHLPLSENFSKIRAPSGLANSIVTVALFNNIIPKDIEVTTIHDVKGKTYDAIMLVSDIDNRGAITGRNVRDWISSDVSNAEYVRFAYVASSRPKHLLIWAISTNHTVEEKNAIKQMLNL